MFIEVLCIITKRSKQSTLSLEEEMNEVWYIHTMEYYSAFTCHNMDEPWGCHTKWNKPFKKRQILCDST